MLSQNRGAAVRLREVAATLSAAGALPAYKRFADYRDCRIRFLGPAFGTKHLAFCSTDERRPALILDRLVSGWLSRNAGLKLDAVPWDASTYERYLEHMYHWSDLLDVRPEDLEVLVFSAEAGRVRQSVSFLTAPPRTISAVRMLVGGVFPPFHDAYEFSPTEGRKWIQSAHLSDGVDLTAMPTIVGRCDQMPAGSWEWLSGRIAESGFFGIDGSPSYPATDMPTWHIEVTGAGFRKRVVSYGGGHAPQEGDQPDDELRAVYDAVCIIEEMARRVPWREVLELHSMMDPGPLEYLAVGG